MNAVELWIKAVRPYAYSASVVPVAIGGLQARIQDPGLFSGMRFAVALAGGVLIHTAANLWNDYDDFRCGVDRPGAGEGSGVLVRGEMTPARCFRGAVVCAVLAGLAGLWLARQAGWGLLVLAGFGLLGARAYSAGPLSPKHRALGEAWVFLMMGVGMTLGGHMAQTGRFSWAAIAAGVPAALLMTLLLYTNNLRDLDADRAAGLRTLPMHFSPAAARGLAGLFLAAAYLVAGLLAATRQLPVATLLALGTLPMAILWYRRIRVRPIADRDVVAVAQLHLVFGLLFSAGLWAGR